MDIMICRGNSEIHYSIPEKIKGEVHEVKVVIPKEFAGKQLKLQISEPTEASNIETDERTIPGHPNCHYGDCYNDCHVVSCAIYQGYEKVPGELD